MDAGDAETYARRPAAASRRSAARSAEVVGRTRSATSARRWRCARSSRRRRASSCRSSGRSRSKGSSTRRSTSGSKEVGVDEVITRKFLTWDDNTHISARAGARPASLPDAADAEDRAVRLAVRAAERRHARPHRAVRPGHLVPHRGRCSPTPTTSSIKEIWQGERFNWYRRHAPRGQGRRGVPCRGCSAWFAGIRDWEHGWLKVLKTSGDHLQGSHAKGPRRRGGDLRTRRAIADV